MTGWEATARRSLTPRRTRRGAPSPLPLSVRRRLRWLWTLPPEIMSPGRQQCRTFVGPLGFPYLEGLSPRYRILHYRHLAFFPVAMVAMTSEWARVGFRAKWL